MELVGIEVRYGRAEPVLHGLDLQLLPGRPAVVLGANGSGKSTLLRVAAGCARPSAGRVTGRPRHVGYVPDRFPSQLRMPAARYLRHLAAMHRCDPAAAPALLAELGFTGSLDEPMAALSKGNAQKVALAQALCSGAGLLVLDEPWSGLDGGAAAALSERIAACTDAVLVSDHTGTAVGLPGCEVSDLVGGRLAPVDGRTVTAGSGPVTVVTLIARDPRAVTTRLPGVPCSVAGDRVVVRVPVGDRDALLRAALSWGCGVHAVEPAR